MNKLSDTEAQVERLLVAANNKYPEIKNHADLARHLSIDHQRLTNWKKRGLPAKEIDFFATEFDCLEKWLRTGIGEMQSPLQKLGIDESDQDFLSFAELWSKTPKALRPHLRSLADSIQQLPTEYAIKKVANGPKSKNK